MTVTLYIINDADNRMFNLIPFGLGEGFSIKGEVPTEDEDSQNLEALYAVLKTAVSNANNEAITSLNLIIKQYVRGYYITADENGTLLYTHPDIPNDEEDDDNNNQEVVPEPITLESDTDVNLNLDFDTVEPIIVEDVVLDEVEPLTVESKVNIEDSEEDEEVIEEKLEEDESLDMESKDEPIKTAEEATPKTRGKRGPKPTNPIVKPVVDFMSQSLEDQTSIEEYLLAKSNIEELDERINKLRDKIEELVKLQDQYNGTIKAFQQQDIFKVIKDNPGLQKVLRVLVED